jgi:hypothetical protein
MAKTAKTSLKHPHHRPDSVAFAARRAAGARSAWRRSICAGDPEALNARQRARMEAGDKGEKTFVNPRACRRRRSAPA